jgi:hypothetical protein
MAHHRFLENMRYTIPQKSANFFCATKRAESQNGATRRACERDRSGRPPRTFGARSGLERIARPARGAPEVRLRGARPNTKENKKSANARPKSSIRAVHLSNIIAAGLRLAFFFVS